MRRLVFLLLFLTPIPASAQDHTPTITAIKTQLVAAGVDLQGACGAFAITGRVAYALRAEGYGLIAKTPGQNGCDTTQGRFAVDALALPDGSAFDILVNAETENIPSWQMTGATNPANWHAPFEMLIPGTEPPHPPNPDPSGDHDALLSLLGDVQSQLLDFREWAEKEIAEVRAEHRAQMPSLDKVSKSSTWQILLGILAAVVGGIGATK